MNMISRGVISRRNGRTARSLIGQGCARRARWRAARSAALRAEGEARHLPVPIGRPVADGAVRLQAAADDSSRAPICRSRSAWDSGSPACRRRSTAFPSCRRSSSSRSTASRARGSASCCRTRPRSSTISPSCKSVHTEAINHDPGGHVLSDRLADRRPAEHGLVGVVRDRQRDGESAGVRRDDLAGPGRHRAASLRPAVGQRLSADADSRA